MKGVTSVVLAGGSSSRFGSNKALAAWDGKAMVESVVERLAYTFPANLVVVKEPRTFGFLNTPRVRVVQDLHEGTHSLGGLWSGLAHATSGHAFVCACDMPFIQPRLVTALWAASSGCDAVVPVWRGKPQPLCGIYSRHCQGVIGCLIKERRLKIQELFAILRTRFFPEEEVKAFDPEGLSFVDLDTRQEYERLQRGRP